MLTGRRAKFPPSVQNPDHGNRSVLYQVRDQYAPLESNHPQTRLQVATIAAKLREVSKAKAIGADSFGVLGSPCCTEAIFKIVKQLKQIS